MIADADQICERLNERLVATEPSKHATTSVLGRNALAHANLEHTALTELSRLPVPAGLRSDWSRILNDREVLASQLLTAAHAWQTDDKHQLTAIAQAKLRVHNAMSTTARRDGFKACTKIGTAS